MSKALIIYGSSTGNTEFTAETIAAVLSDSGYDVTVRNAADTGISVLDGKYDRYFLGCSTWGEDEIELQEDFESFFDDMTQLDSLKGKAFSLFGCGDSSYTYFCGAVDLLEELVRKLGGNQAGTSLRIDGEPEEQEIREWTEEVLDAA